MATMDVMRVKQVISSFRKRKKVDGFELTEFICNGEPPRFNLSNLFAELYAKMGLHRYNLLKGKNYELVRTKKYSYRPIYSASPYYIILDARDLENSSIQTFEVEVEECTFRKLDLICDIARKIDDPDKSPPPRVYQFPIDPPKLPVKNPFKDKNRLYVAKNSELEDKDKAWIRLYLELAVARPLLTNREDHDLSNLKIVKVAIDNKGGLNAIVYISYKDNSKARVGMDVDRIAIVRRTYDEDTECFKLVGQTLPKPVMPKIVTNRRPYLFYSHWLGVFRRWRLSGPRRCKKFKKRGLRMARCLHKTRSIIKM